MKAENLDLTCGCLNKEEEKSKITACAALLLQIIKSCNYCCGWGFEGEVHCYTVFLKQP